MRRTTLPAPSRRPPPSSLTLWRSRRCCLDERSDDALASPGRVVYFKHSGGILLRRRPADEAEGPYREAFYLSARRSDPRETPSLRPRLAHCYANSTGTVEILTSHALAITANGRLAVAWGDRSMRQPAETPARTSKPPRACSRPTPRVARAGAARWMNDLSRRRAVVKNSIALAAAVRRGVPCSLRPFARAELHESLRRSPGQPPPARTPSACT